MFKHMQYFTLNSTNFMFHLAFEEDIHWSTWQSRHNWLYYFCN